jgi:UDP-N-acetylmuramoylalanine--D-glutamate ligase
VVLIGRDARLIAANIPGTPVAFASDLDDAVVKARMDALPGDVVLFSPACASFDMFENFVVRGQAFTRIVEGMSK